MGLRKYCLARMELRQGSGIVSATVVVFLYCFSGNEVVWDLFKIYSVRGCQGHSSVQLCRISLGDGRFGPIGIKLMLSRRL